jgi:hypothetical protein
MRIRQVLLGICKSFPTQEIFNNLLLTAFSVLGVSEQRSRSVQVVHLNVPFLLSRNWFEISPEPSLSKGGATHVKD